MKNFIKTFIISWILSQMCYTSAPHSLSTADIGRIIPEINTLGAFSYSSAISPYSPLETTITIVQSSGIRSYFCQLPSSTSTGIVCVSMHINNRFGSRFCNHSCGQLALQLVGQHLYNTLYSTKWSTTDISALVGTSGITFSMTHTTSGLAFTVVCPSAMLTNTFTLFKTILLDIYNKTMSDTEFDSLCSTLSTSLTSSTKSATPTNDQSLAVCMTQPKWDCTHTYAGKQIGGLFGLPLGFCDLYGSTTLNSWTGIQSNRDRAKLCLSLFKREKDITFFVASPDSYIADQLPGCMKTIYDTFYISQLTTYSKVYFGNHTIKGTYTFSNPSGSNITSSGILYLGPISAYNLIAAQLILYLAKTGLITSTSYKGVYGNDLFMSIIPIGGQVTFRLSSHTLDSIPTSAWSTFITTLKTRYTNGQNLSELSTTNLAPEISKLYNHVLPGPSHTNDSSNINSVLTPDAQGYVNWMYLFQGSFKAITDLNTINTGSTDTTSALLSNVASIISNTVDITQSTEVIYTTL